METDLLPTPKERKTQHSHHHHQPGFKLAREHITLSIRDMLCKLPPKDTDYCIYRVPDSLRRLNPECYTPRLVSIGPLHHNNLKLKPAEDRKLRFLKSFLAKTDKEVLDIIDFIVREEPAIRRNYQEEINLGAEDFSHMIFLDSVFIIELLLKKEEKHAMFENHWLFCDLLNDILLIENQIPLYIPNFIYKYYCEFEGVRKGNFVELVNNFFKEVMMTSEETLALRPQFPLDQSSGPRHFLEYLRMIHIPESPLLLDPPPSNPELPQARNNNNKIKEKKKAKTESLTASRLLECGVRFEEGNTTSLVDIKFDTKRGILTIPQVKVNEWTETFFLNMVAYEQCHHLHPRFFTDYVMFMDSLINTPEEVGALVEAGIIKDDFQDQERVSSLLNNLHKEAITEERYYYYAKRSNDIKIYRRSCWHRFRAWWYNAMSSLRKDYFNTPWAIASCIAAITLLGLTIVQTVCSIYQAKGRFM